MLCIEFKTGPCNIVLQVLINYVVEIINHCSNKKEMRNSCYTEMRLV